MNSSEIYKLASEMTEQEVENVIGGWKAANKKESIKDYNSLVQLGDSKQLACATVILSKTMPKKANETYHFAYTN